MSILEQVKNSRVKPDGHLFYYLIGRTKSYGEVKMIHSKLKEMGFKPNQKHYLALLHLTETYYEANMIFEEMKEKDVNIKDSHYIALIAKTETIEGGKELLKKINNDGIQLTEAILKYREVQEEARIELRSDLKKSYPELPERFLTENSKLPPLKPSNRSREYEIYSIKEKDSIVFEYLFNSKSHRWLDENILKIPMDIRTGHESMNILHFIGLRGEHKGIFQDYSIVQAIKRLGQKEEDEFSLLIQSLNRLNRLEENNEKLKDILENDIDSENAEDDNYYKDGAVKYYYGKRYERNVENRKKAIEIHGLSCVVCGFNYEEIYGERGAEFIEVHHVNPLSTLNEETVINPETDLVPVCSNCHRMIHRRKDNVLTIEELKEITKGIKKNYTINN